MLYGVLNNVINRFLVSNWHSLCDKNCNLSHLNWLFNKCYSIQCNALPKILNEIFSKLKIYKSFMRIMWLICRHDSNTVIALFSLLFTQSLLEITLATCCKHCWRNFVRVMKWWQTIVVMAKKLLFYAFLLSRFDYLPRKKLRVRYLT